jgi:hypothetical protein
MATFTKAWTTGTGNLYITYSGILNDTISISSDANTLTTDRSMSVTLQTKNGTPAVSKTLTITQLAKSGDFNVDFNNDFS